MNKRENALLALRGGKPECVPCYYDSCQIMLCSAIKELPPPGVMSGTDGYGVHQTANAAGGGGYTPTPGHAPVIRELAAWREQLVLPDPDSFDWAEQARLDAIRKPFDRENYLQDILYVKGPFERLHFLLGFEEALIQIMEEPETVYELVGAITDNKIKHIRKIAQYYKPDIITSHDDFAFHRGLFFPAEIFREIFKPHLKRLVDAVHAEGLLYKQHCCGKMDALAEDFLDIGIDALDPVQPVNDIAYIQEVFKGKIGLSGGLDVQNVIDPVDVPESEIRAEVRRCIDSYTADGGFMLYGASLHMYDPASYRPGGRLYAVCDECGTYGRSRG